MRGGPELRHTRILQRGTTLSLMCGRYALSKLRDELLAEFKIDVHSSQHSKLSHLSQLSKLPADWNIAPTREIYIVKSDGSESGPDNSRTLATASWGIIAPWSKDSPSALRSQSQAINARSESIDSKPTFKSAFRNRRCLIPADGYYEWATELGRYKPKQPFYISHELWESERKSLAFAGIWDRWISPEGRIVDSAAIITRPAVGFLATVHSRMPTFLPEERWDHWLDPSLREVDEIRALMLLTQPDAGLVARPVSDAVNSIRNTGPELISPIELGEPETLF
jgi:putative SOS response-associated peptidase YedK